MLVAGTLLKGRYRVMRLFKQGGMAFVYEGFDITNRQRILIKVLRPELAARQEFSERLRHEALILAKLHHPNIVRYIDFQSDSNYTYLILQWVPGRPLSEHIRERTYPYKPEEITPWIHDITQALIHLEDKGIIHRDVKPANIIITPDNRAVLIDFSIALDRRTSLWDPLRASHIGTASYAAPEQMQGQFVDTRADIYSLSTIIFELLTLRRPFSYLENGEEEGSSWDVLSVAKSSMYPRSPASYVSDLDPRIARLVERMLAPVPAQRLHSAREVWAIWHSVVGERSKRPAPFPISRDSHTRPQWQRTYMPVLAVLALGFLVLLVGTYLFRPMDDMVTLWVGKCQEVPLEMDDVHVQWRMCVETVQYTRTTLRVNVTWAANIVPDNVVLTKDDDIENRNMYLIDASRHRYDHTRVGGDASRTVDVHSGQPLSGWYEFPRPNDLSQGFIFVDEDLGIQVHFRVRP